MSKAKKYVLWSVMFILISSLATTEISHANKFKDFLDKIKSKYHTEVIPVTSAGENSHSGEAYTIIPRVDKSTGKDYSGESGVRYYKKEDPKYPGDATKKINKSITYQVISKGPYPRGKISWRTDRIKC